jgi:hypothetical protein
MPRSIPHPSPALAVAMLSLLVALTGTAVASGVVPVATRALNADNADNAKKLQGKTSAQLVGLASAKSQLADDATHLQGKSPEDIVSLAQTKSVAGFFTVKQANFSMPANSMRD